MRGRKSALVVLLDDGELQQLNSWCRSTTTAVGLVRRASVILGLYRGLTVKAAASNAGMSETHARKWIQRFLEHRLEGLKDAARPGRPSSFSPQR
jgi:transposase